jgi:hypothetical protein
MDLDTFALVNCLFVGCVFNRTHLIRAFIPFGPLTDPKPAVLRS